MIIVTGAAGFIGSCMIASLLSAGYKDLVGIDEFSVKEKERNHISKDSLQRIERSALFQFIEDNKDEISFIIHLGARTDTVDQNPIIFEELNVEYSKKIWGQCTKFNIPLIYASSAATYGDGRHGFDDEMEDLEKLTPLNEYGRSKQIFDVWASRQVEKPPYWVGLKFFNVYGPNEYHKNRMASVIFHAFHQIRKTGKMRLFRSHVPEFENGFQLRDFIYVKDVCSTILKLIGTKINPGIYNLGTGKARTFLDLVNGVFNALEIESQIEFIDIPEDIRDNYQYFTEAPMLKLKNQGIDIEFSPLESGIEDYVKNYLVNGSYM